MAQEVTDYLGELEVALIELSSSQREDALDEVYGLITEMRSSGMSDAKIVRQLGPVKKIAKEYLRKYGKGSTLNKMTESMTSRLTSSGSSARTNEYYLRFYDGGTYKIGLQDIRPLGKLETVASDTYRLYSTMTEMEIVRYLEKKLGLNNREYELVNPRTGVSY